VNAITIALPGRAAGDEAVPNAILAIRQVQRYLVAVLVKQANLDPLGDATPDRKISPVVARCGTKAIEMSRCNVH
jgi:hypothetical protein